MHLDDVHEGDAVIAEFELGSLIGPVVGKVVDKWVTDLPFEVRIGVEFPVKFYDMNMECKGHSCRGKGMNGFCYYLNLNEIKLKG